MDILALTLCLEDITPQKSMLDEADLELRNEWVVKVSRFKSIVDTILASHGADSEIKLFGKVSAEYMEKARSVTTYGSKMFCIFNQVQVCLWLWSSECGAVF